MYFGTRYWPWTRLYVTLTVSIFQGENLDINTDARQFFTGTASFEAHHNAQETNKTRYAAALTVMTRSGVEVAQSMLAIVFKNSLDLISSFLIFEPTCAYCTVGSYASLSVCPSVCLSLFTLDNNSYLGKYYS